MASKHHIYQNKGYIDNGVGNSNEYDHIDPLQVSTAPSDPTYTKLTGHNRIDNNTDRTGISGQQDSFHGYPNMTNSSRSCVIIVVIITLVAFVVGAIIAGMAVYFIIKTGELLYLFPKYSDNKTCLLIII